MRKQKTPKSDRVSETKPEYSSPLLQYTTGKEIVISSLEAQEEANYLYWLSLTPLQRLELHYKMIRTVYKEKSFKKKNSIIIIFSNEYFM